MPNPPVPESRAKQPLSEDDRNSIIVYLARMRAESSPGVPGVYEKWVKNYQAVSSGALLDMYLLVAFGKEMPESPLDPTGIPGLPNPLDPNNPANRAGTAIGKDITESLDFLRLLTSGELWQRVAYVGIGAILITVGVRAVTK